MKHNLKPALKKASGLLGKVNKSAKRGDHVKTVGLAKDALTTVEPITHAAESLAFMAGRHHVEERANVIGMWMGYYRIRLDETVNHLATAYQIHGDLLNILGKTYLDLKQPRDAVASLEERAGLARRLRDGGSESMALSLIGRILDQYLDQPHEAVERYEQALTLARSAHQPLAVHSALTGLASVYERLGRTEDAALCRTEASLLEPGLGSE